MTRPYKGRSSTALPDTSWVWTEISLRPRAAQAALLQACVVPALRKLREGQGTRRVGHARKIKNLGTRLIEHRGVARRFSPTHQVTIRTVGDCSR